MKRIDIENLIKLENCKISIRFWGKFDWQEFNLIKSYAKKKFIKTKECDIYFKDIAEFKLI